jgi:hypothetical protein
LERNRGVRDCHIPCPKNQKSPPNHQTRRAIRQRRRSAIRRTSRFTILRPIPPMNRNSRSVILRPRRDRTPPPDNPQAEARKSNRFRTATTYAIALPRRWRSSEVRALLTGIRFCKGVISKLSERPHFGQENALQPCCPSNGGTIRASSISCSQAEHFGRFSDCVTLASLMSRSPTINTVETYLFRSRRLSRRRANGLDVAHDQLGDGLSVRTEFSVGWSLSRVQPMQALPRLPRALAYR